MEYPGSSRRRRQGYYELTRTPTYSMLAALPLLVAYELGAWLMNVGAHLQLRNAADVALKEPFLHLGAYGPPAFLVAVAGAMALVYYRDTRKRKLPIIKGYFPLMLLEGLLYAVLFGPLVNALLHLAPGMAGVDAARGLVLSLGAGVYEEILFRVILVSALFAIFGQVLRWKSSRAYVAAALVGAVLFSAYHYTGPFGDTFTLHSFLFRALAGLLLNGLYLARGFGVTAYTHAFYDVIVTLRMVM